MATDRLIPLAEIREVLAELMTGREHMSRGPCMTRDADGWHKPAALPPEEGLRLSDFLDALTGLPDPALESAIAEVILPVLRERGLPFLGGELAELCDRKWPEAASSIPDAIPGSGPRCMHCGAPIPPERGPLARFCKNSHRVSAAKRKRRLAEQAARALPRYPVRHSPRYPGDLPSTGPGDSVRAGQALQIGGPCTATRSPPEAWPSLRAWPNYVKPLLEVEGWPSGFVSGTNENG